MGLNKKFTVAPERILAELLTVDGPGSQLNADLLDGYHAGQIIDQAEESVSSMTSITAAASKIPMGSAQGKIDQSWLPPANVNQIGAVKPGSGLSVSSDGTLTVDNSSGYTLPPATAGTLGGVKIGANITVETDGTISAPSPTAPYTLQPATAGTLGGIIVGSGLNIDSNGVLSLLAGSDIIFGTKEAGTTDVNLGHMPAIVFVILTSSGTMEIVHSDNSASKSCYSLGSGSASTRPDSNAWLTTTGFSFDTSYSSAVCNYIAIGKR